MKQFDQDLVSGSVLRSVSKLAWPVILAHLISGSHGFVDQMLVGNYVEGVAANAAIGASWQVFLVVIVFVASLFHGMGILIARYSGRQDRDAVNRVAFGVFVISFYILAFVVAPLGYLLTPTLLELTNVTQEVQAHARPYLRIMFTASTPLFLMFLFNGAFLATGQPKISLVLNIVTTITNIGVSYVLISGAGPFPAMGTAGAAIGTCLGPVPSVILAIYIIKSGRTIIRLPEKMRFTPDWSLIREVARIGLPTGIQGVLLNVAGVFLLRFVGSLENPTESIAAYTICYSQLFALVTWAGFGIRSSSATLVGQNIGAGNPDRAQRAVHVSACFGFAWAVALGLLFWNFPGTLLGLFGADTGDTLVMGSRFLRYLSFSGIFLASTMAFTGGLQGAGDTKKPMVIAFVSQIVVLLGLCYAFERTGRLTDSAIWGAILCAHASRFVMSLVVFQQGGWKNVRIGIESDDQADASPADAVTGAKTGETRA